MLAHVSTIPGPIPLPNIAATPSSPVKRPASRRTLTLNSSPSLRAFASAGMAPATTALLSAWPQAVPAGLGVQAALYHSGLPRLHPWAPQFFGQGQPMMPGAHVIAFPICDVDTGQLCMQARSHLLTAWVGPQMIPWQAAPIASYPPGPSPVMMAKPGVTSFIPTSP